MIIKIPMIIVRNTDKLVIFVPILGISFYPHSNHGLMVQLVQSFVAFGILSHILSWKPASLTRDNDEEIAFCSLVIVTSSPISFSTTPFKSILHFEQVLCVIQNSPSLSSRSIVKHVRFTTEPHQTTQFHTNMNISIFYSLGISLTQPPWSCFKSVKYLGAFVPRNLSGAKLPFLVFKMY